ncbi:MAG: class I SAM-dependent methyltransferase [Actinomycetota bacterium]|nr:class I SAM-dependent methyltransferase [Actinomycetota bacterium]
MRFVESLADQISHRNRKAKFHQFLRHVAPREDETILDVGVADKEYSENDNYLEKHYPHPANIVAVARTSLDDFSLRYPHIRVVTADGRALPFADDEFDIAYSNAVIEHVGSSESQLAFLRELHRVARSGYLTTPNRRFPIEVHTRIPLLHVLLPKKWFHRFLISIGKGWAAGDYMHLLSERDLRRLLHKTAITDFRIIRNRFLGMTMTFSVSWSKRADVTATRRPGRAGCPTS